MCAWISSTARALIRPSAIPRWFVTTITRAPCSLSARIPAPAPGSNANPATDSTYSPSAGLRLIVPSRSRNTVSGRMRSGREERRLHDLAEDVAEQTVRLLDARRLVRRHADAEVGRHGQR